MRNLNLIIKREYLSRVRKKSFVVLTILMPLLFIALIFMPMLLSRIKDSEIKHIVVIDPTGKYAPYLKSTPIYSFEAMNISLNDIQQNLGQNIFGALQITDDLSLNPSAINFFSDKHMPIGLQEYVRETLSQRVKEDQLSKLVEGMNVEPTLARDMQHVLLSPNNISISTFRWDKDGLGKENSTTVTAFIGMFFTFLMYIFILMYGVIVMNGVIEEKSNRIVEVMISSVKPFDLMMGKIIGIGLTGLTQLLIWIIIGVVVFLFRKGDLAESNIEIESILPSLHVLSAINWFDIIIYFLLLFIGGYLMYASLFAMFGAAVDNAQDTQQFVMPITIIFLFSFYVGIYSTENPSGPLAFWCSMIPFTSPIVMMVRIPFGVPLWEKILSISILYITIYFVVTCVAKIYRIGILMYGKKVNLRELIKWFSYK